MTINVKEVFFVVYQNSMYMLQYGVYIPGPIATNPEHQAMMLGKSQENLSEYPYHLSHLGSE